LGNSDLASDISVYGQPTVVSTKLQFACVMLISEQLI